MYQKVLVPVDGSELAECVLPHIESIAKGCCVKNVTFIYVVKPVSSSIWAGEESLPRLIMEASNRMESEARATGERYLMQLLGRVKYDGVDIQSQVMFGDHVADVIADYATKNEADLIIISTHGRSGISRWAWGSVADRILRATCVPVLMVRAPGCIHGI
ncbi:universal stress protein [Chloroflexota bacterium]